MNHLPRLLTTCVLTLSICVTAEAQQETLDIISFTPPADYTRAQVSGAVTFTKYNATKTGYSYIAITNSRSGTGHYDNEFIADWDALIKAKYGVAAPTSVERIQGANEYVVVSGSSMIKTDHEFMTTLITVSGHQRVASIVVMTNDPAFQTEQGEFFKTIQFIVPAATKPEVVAVTETKSTTSATPATQTATQKKIPAGKTICGLCVYGYHSCGSCSGVGRKSETVYVSEYDYNSKSYRQRPQIQYNMCMACSGAGKTICARCMGTGMVDK